MELNYVDIGKRIRTIRKNLGISQEQLAEMTNLSVVHISHIETANTKLSLPALVAVANALSVTADVLLCGNLDTAVTEAVRDCSGKELRIISESVIALKQALRKWETKEL